MNPLLLAQLISQMQQQMQRNPLAQSAGQFRQQMTPAFSQTMPGSAPSLDQQPPLPTTTDLDSAIAQLVERRRQMLTTMAGQAPPDRPQAIGKTEGIVAGLLQMLGGMAQKGPDANMNRELINNAFGQYRQQREGQANEKYQKLVQSYQQNANKQQLEAQLLGEDVQQLEGRRAERVRAIDSQANDLRDDARDQKKAQEGFARQKELMGLEFENQKERDRLVEQARKDREIAIQTIKREVEADKEKGRNERASNKIEADKWLRENPSIVDSARAEHYRVMAEWLPKEKASVIRKNAAQAEKALRDPGVSGQIGGGGGAMANPKDYRRNLKDGLDAQGRILATLKDELNMKQAQRNSIMREKDNLAFDDEKGIALANSRIADIDNAIEQVDRAYQRAQDDMVIISNKLRMAAENGYAPPTITLGPGGPSTQGVIKSALEKGLREAAKTEAAQAAKDKKAKSKTMPGPYAPGKAPKAKGDVKYRIVG